MENKDKLEVVIITTGGTIDKSYDEFDGSLDNRQSQIKKMLLEKLRLPHTYLHVFSIFSKDSLHMTNYDRKLLAGTIQSQADKKYPIVILHGTDTMAKTAEYCSGEINDPKVPIIFTGAMKPLGFDDSDAKQNVTEALLAARLLKPGIYISFHNCIFPVPGTRKNHEQRTFERIVKK